MDKSIEFETIFKLKLNVLSKDISELVINSDED